MDEDKKDAGFNEEPQEHKVQSPIGSMSSLQSPTLKRKFSKRRKIILIIGVVLVIVVGLPVYVMGSLFVSLSSGCSQKMTDLDKQTSDVKNKIDAIALPLTKTRVYTNGDCLTGSGTQFQFTVQKDFASPDLAKQEIVNAIKSVGIPALSDNTKPYYIYGKDDNVSGGATPINQIDVGYYINGYDSYDFTYQLKQKIPCLVISEEKVTCNGVEEKQLLSELLTSEPISSANFSGSVRSDYKYFN